MNVYKTVTVYEFLHAVSVMPWSAAFQEWKPSDHIAKWCYWMWQTKTTRRCYWNINDGN